MTCRQAVEGGRDEGLGPFLVGPSLQMLFGFWLRWAIFLFVVWSTILQVPYDSFYPCLYSSDRCYQEFWPFSCQSVWGRVGPPAMPTPVDPAKMPSEYRPWRPGSASLAQSHLF